jgi:dienelactone hydrolase
MLAAVRSLAFALPLLAPLAHAQAPLPGFTLNGTDWSYDPGDGGVLITGKLVQPTTGTAPFPAVLISHGQNGNATGFGVQKANVMKTWGLVCIAPNYTHVDLSYAAGTDGFSPENLRRANACLTILASLGTVDMARVAAYGNSKGAFLTAGLCGSGAAIRAAAITAGGTSGSTNPSFAAPATQECTGITAPFLMLHGTADTTVFPVQSVNLQALLAEQATVNRRELWTGVGHNLHQDRAAAVESLIRAWFTAHGVLASGANTRPSITTPGAAVLAVSTPSAPIAFTVGDDLTSVNALTVSAFALDDALVSPAGLVLGGAGANRTLTITPVAGASGATEIALVVSDGTLTRATAFPLLVGSGARAVVCDPHAQSTCPCATLGADGRGCPHAADPLGAALAANGVTSPDSIALVATAMPATTACVFLQGDAHGTLPLGDGALCAGGSLVRLGVAFASGGVASTPSGGELPVSVRGGVTPGSGAMRVYQTWYRDATANYCTSATNNLTSAVLLVW